MYKQTKTLASSGAVDLPHETFHKLNCFLCFTYDNSHSRTVGGDHSNAYLLLSSKFKTFPLFQSLETIYCI